MQQMPAGYADQRPKIKIRLARACRRADCATVLCPDVSGFYRTERVAHFLRDLSIFPPVIILIYEHAARIGVQQIHPFANLSAQ